MPASARVPRIGSLVSAALLTLGLLAASASAQGGAGGGGGGGGGDGQGRGGGFRGMGGFGQFGQDMFTPGVDSRELERYREFLDLSAEQQDTVRALFEGYNEEFRSAAAGARQAMDATREKARESGDRSGFQEMRGLTQDFRRKRDDMEKAFFSDVQAVLSPDQQARWPKVERVRRRERTVPRGLMSGERVDVIQIVEGQRLAPETSGAVSPILEAYEADLDRALIERNKAYEEGFARMGEIFGGGDPEAARAEAQRLMDSARQASVRVRDVNRKYARQVQAVLPEAAQWEFERAVKRASFPRIYREARASREITAAKGFSDLDDSQRQALGALSDSFQRDLATLNDQLARATEEVEETITAERIMRLRRDEVDDGPAGDLWRKRRDLERSASESLKKLLRPEQIERLPGPEETDEGDGRGRRRPEGAAGAREDGNRPQRRGGGGR